MALPDSFFVTSGTSINFADTSYAPVSGNMLGIRTDQINLSRVDHNRARQSNKTDLGLYRAASYSVMTNLEFSSPPTTGTVEFWWAPSINPISGYVNPGFIAGLDGPYWGYGNNQTHLDNAIRQLQYIGDFPCSTVQSPSGQIGYVGELVPTHRYGTLVVYNKAGSPINSGVTQVVVSLIPNYGLVVD